MRSPETGPKRPAMTAVRAAVLFAALFGAGENAGADPEVITPFELDLDSYIDTFRQLERGEEMQGKIDELEKQLDAENQRLGQTPPAGLTPEGLEEWNKQRQAADLLGEMVDSFRSSLETVGSIKEIAKTMVCSAAIHEDLMDRIPLDIADNCTISQEDGSAPVSDTQNEFIS